MAPSACIELDRSQQGLLLDIARRSIHSGLDQGKPLSIPPTDPGGPLSAAVGVFVTLTRDNALRGCIGSMQSPEPLASSVADSAFKAAFRDPRFPPLEVHETEHVHIEISVLSPLQPLVADSRQELLAGLRPAVDGVLLQDGHYRSTFLPQVWEQLPDPDAFLEQLLAKAGLPAGHWSKSIRFHRYQTLSFDDREPSQLHRNNT